VTTHATSDETLVARTVALDLPVGDLVDLLPVDAPVTWLRRGEGLVGWGVAAMIRTSGPTRYSDAAKWWSETIARTEVTDEVAEPGTGPVCFGSFAFGRATRPDRVDQPPVPQTGERTRQIGVLDSAEPADSPQPLVQAIHAQGRLEALVGLRERVQDRRVQIRVLAGAEAEQLRRYTFHHPPRVSARMPG
jgi:menaquinone-specific isochorismate synthase